MTEREMLELAANAAGIEIKEWSVPFGSLSVCWIVDRQHPYGARPWAPLTDDGDALRLAVKLNLDIRYDSYDAGIAVIVGAAWDDAPEASHEVFERDGQRAVRLAITRAAAEIGRSKHE